MQPANLARAGRLLGLRAASASWPSALHIMLEHQRSLQIFQVFSKEGKEERARKLKVEMSKGYFDDFKQLRDTEGRVVSAPDRLIAAQAAPSFPDIQVTLASTSQAAFPADLLQGHKMALLTAGFRAGSESMLQSWSGPFGEHFAQHQDVRWLDLALIDSVVMRMWPFRNLIVSSGASQSSHGAELQPHKAFYFGDTDQIMQAARMTNRLTGYVYLLDSAGRLRWQASGPAQAQEVPMFLRLAEGLLEEQS